MRIHDYLEYWALRSPERLCVEDGITSLSYGELNESADAFARSLRTRGLTPGDRIAIVAKNCTEWATLYYGAFKAGVVPVPLNFRLHPREWIHQVNDSGAQVLFAQDPFAAGFEEIENELTVRARVLIGAERPGWESLTDWFDRSDQAPVPAPDVSSDDDLYQMYTSGTTGRPKGAVITHAAANANVTQIRTAMPLYPAEDVLLVMPLFHAGAAVSFFFYVASGASVHVMADFDPTACVDALDQGGVVIVTFVPAMIQAMLVHVPDIADRTFDHLRLIAYGASPIAEETLRQAIEVFGCDFVQAYGQTESCATLTLLCPEDHHRALDGKPELLLSCGRPMVGTDVAVVDSVGTRVGPGQVGEIVARGPQVMRGYWNLPSENAAILAEGWLHTGDAGHLDDEGYLFISDRVKDLIVSGGENIYPREIEDVLYEMPEVAEAAVIGVPDQRWGEAVKAVVVTREGTSLTEDDVLGFCRDRLASYKCPRTVDLVRELPRNATGKVLKTELRAPYWQGQRRSVGG